jgi:excisionase family DNA binding protein
LLPSLSHFGATHVVLVRSAVVSTLQKQPAPSTPPPDFLTVDEAARIVRVGRTTAYDMARLYEATSGAAGLPVIRLGKQLRVPRCRLEDWLGGPISWPIACDEPKTVSQPAAGRQARKRTRRRGSNVQTAQLLSV